MELVAQKDQLWFKTTDTLPAMLSRLQQAKQEQR
jgi:hypothetical protein